MIFQFGHWKKVSPEQSVNSEGVFIQVTELSHKELATACRVGQFLAKIQA